MKTTFNLLLIFFIFPGIVFAQLSDDNASDSVMVENAVAYEYVLSDSLVWKRLTEELASRVEVKENKRGKLSPKINRTHLKKENGFYKAEFHIHYSNGVVMPVHSSLMHNGDQPTIALPKMVLKGMPKTSEEAFSIAESVSKCAQFVRCYCYSGEEGNRYPQEMEPLYLAEYDRVVYSFNCVSGTGASPSCIGHAKLVIDTFSGAVLEKDCDSPMKGPNRSKLKMSK